MCNNNYKCENRHKNAFFHHLYNLMIGYSFTFIRWYLSIHFFQNKPLFQNAFYKLPYAFGTRFYAHDLLTWPLTGLPAAFTVTLGRPMGSIPSMQSLPIGCEPIFPKEYFSLPGFVYRIMAYSLGWLLLRVRCL